MNSTAAAAWSPGAAFGSQGNALGCLIFPNIPDFALDRGGSVSL